MTEPSPKSPYIERLLEGMSSRSTSISKEQCIPKPIGCGRPATEFRDRLSRKEFTISGLCQECQDKIFGE